MSYFSELLTFYSKRIGINSPQIAGYCNLDRVTVYRFMKGKTLPKDRETILRIAEILQLARDEKDALIEAYECTRLGSQVYRERQYIRTFIQTFSGVPPMIPVIQYDTDDVEEPGRDALVISGRDNTIKRIQKEILKECEKPCCEINLIMRSGISVVMDMLLSAGKKNKSLRVKHLIPITIDYQSEANNGIKRAVSADESYLDPQHRGDHELLQNIFKVVRMCGEGFDYEPSYYYTRQEESGQFPEYSNILITGASVILFTNDLKESILFAAPDQVDSFREKYHRYADDKPPLFYFYRNVESLVDIMNRIVINRDIKMDEMEYYYSSLPCVLPFLRKETIDQHICLEEIARSQNLGENSLRTIYDYVEALYNRYTNGDINEINYLSEAGVRHFLKTGRFAEVPLELYSPLTVEERRELIMIIAEHPHFKAQLFKEELSAPEGMLCIEVMDKALMIVFHIQGKGMCYLYMNEPGIHLAFRNFFRDFPKEEMYSEEESKEILRRIAREEI